MVKGIITNTNRCVYRGGARLCQICTGADEEVDRKDEKIMQAHIFESTRRYLPGSKPMSEILISITA